MDSGSVPDLSKWVEDYTSDLYTWALYKTSNEELAKDLVQDTFMAAAEKPGTFKGNSSPKTYLFAILNNKIIDYYRKRINSPLNLENDQFESWFDDSGSWLTGKKPVEWHEEDNILDDTEFQVILQDCIDNLPDKWRVCVTSKYLLEKNSTGVCQELGIKPTNYWQVMHRAKLQLRECIEINWFQK